MPKIWVTRLVFWADGFTLLPSLVLINPKAQNDQGLRAHELVHVAQMKSDGVLKFWWRYITSPEWRAHYEADAYQTSLKYNGSVEFYAKLLMKNYFLDLTLEQATELIKPATA